MRMPSAVIVGAVVGAVLVAGQEPTPQTPVFRGLAMGVYVDVYPTRNGRFVAGLTPGDFEVREDGVLQKIELFDLVRFEISPADAERRDPSSVEEGERLAGDPRHRAFVVYFDNYHLTSEGARNMRGPVVEFLERTIGPTDYFAALNPDVPPALLVFGQRTETIAREVDRYWPAAFGADQVHEEGIPPPMSAHEEWLNTCYLNRLRDSRASAYLMKQLFMRWRQELVLRGLAGLVRKLATIREERTNVLLFASGWNLTGPDDALMNDAWGPSIGPGTKPGTVNGTPPLGARPAGTPDVQACDAELFRLANLDFRAAFRQLLTDARRANVAFSTIDPGGLSTFNRYQGATVAATEALLTPLTVLAANTSGRSVNSTNDIRTPLQELATDLSAYYLLGYYTSNSKLDGKYRKIEVKARSKELKVSARDGYFGPTPATPRSRAGAAAPAGASPATPAPMTGALNVLARLDTSVRLFAEASATAREVVIVAEIAASEASRWPRGGDVQVDLTGRGGASAGAVAGRIDPRARSTVIHVPVGDAAGPWQAHVKVRGLDDTLETDLDVSRGPAGLLGHASVFRAAGARAAVWPVADHLFRRTERLRLEWTPGVAIDRREARLLDRRGTPVGLSMPLADRPGGGRPVLVADLDLAPLAPGDYVIEITAGSGTQTEQQFIAIRVGR